MLFDGGGPPRLSPGGEEKKKKGSGGPPAVIEHRPLPGRNVGIDLKPRVPLDLLELTLEALDRGLRQRRRTRQDHRRGGECQEAVSHPHPQMKASSTSAAQERGGTPDAKPARAAAAVHRERSSRSVVYRPAEI